MSVESQLQIGHTVTLFAVTIKNILSQRILLLNLHDKKTTPWVTFQHQKPQIKQKVALLSIKMFPQFFLN